MFTYKQKSKTLKKITCACTVLSNGQERQQEVILFLYDGRCDEVREGVKKATKNTTIAYKVTTITIAKDGEVKA